MKRVLTIAGSDPSGGAGIQADIKTITAHKMYAMSAITALTAQNTTGVFGVLDISADFVTKQLDCIFEDIFPDAVKIGMVSNPEIIEAIADRLTFYSAKNIVLDPVMVATSGGRLMMDGAALTLKKRLLPLADVITPNLPEAMALSGMANLATCEDMAEAARIIGENTGAAILIKGGHAEDGSADDLLFEKERCEALPGIRIDTQNTHGTGCTLSSAIACGLAEGKTVLESCRYAKAYVSGALAAGLDLGRGSGPLEHCWNM